MESSKTSSTEQVVPVEVNAVTVSAKAAPSAKKSPPGSNATSPSSSASQPESAAPSSSASSAAACAPTAVAPSSRNTLRLPHRCLTNPAVAQGGIEADLWALLPWANITTAILLRRDRHHQTVRRRRGNRIRMRRMAMCPCRRRCIGVVCGMRKLFVFCLVFVLKGLYHGHLHPWALES